MHTHRVFKALKQIKVSFFLDCHSLLRVVALLGPVEIEVHVHAHNLVMRYSRYDKLAHMKDLAV